MELLLGYGDCISFCIEDVKEHSELCELLQVTKSCLVDDGKDVVLHFLSKSLFIRVSFNEGTTTIVTSFGWDNEDERCCELIAEILKFFQPCQWNGWKMISPEKVVYSEDYVKVDHEDLTLKLHHQPQSMAMLSVANKLLQNCTGFTWVNSVISKDAVKTIGDGLKLGEVGGYINLISCELLPEAFEEFCSTLSQRKVPLGLVLSKCNLGEITGDTLKPIADLIEATNVGALILRNLGLTQEAIETIIDPLMKSKIIQTLDLSLNKVSDVYAIRLCSSLIRNRFIEKIFLESHAVVKSETAEPESVELEEDFIGQLRTIEPSRVLGVSLAYNRVGQKMMPTVAALKGLGLISPSINLCLGNPRERYVRARTPNSEERLSKDTGGEDAQESSSKKSKSTSEESTPSTDGDFEELSEEDFEYLGSEESE